MRVLPLAVSLLLAACVTNPVIRTDFDSAANFHSYHTYSWLPVDVPRGMNPIMFRRVQGAIDQALAARGYRQASPSDFTIGFTIGEKDRVEVYDHGFYGGWGGGGWGGWGWGYPYGWGGGFSPIDIDTVTERSLVIDIYDSGTRQAVWHGVARKDAYSDDVDYSRMNETIGAVLAHFPPQSGMH